MLVALTVLAIVTLLPGIAVAGSPPLRVVVGPETLPGPNRPLSSDTVTVTFTAGRLKPEDRYVVGLQKTGAGRVCAGTACSCARSGLAGASECRCRPT